MLSLLLAFNPLIIATASATTTNSNNVGGVGIDGALTTNLTAGRISSNNNNNNSSSSSSSSSIGGGGRHRSTFKLDAFPPTTPGSGGGGGMWQPVLGSWNNPVLVADNTTWEHSAVQEPQVIYQPATKSLRMWYRGAGWGFPSGVGVADSTDGGKTWKKHPRNPVYANDCAGQPWVYKESTTSGHKYWLFTTNNHPARVCVATSTDGVSWQNATASSASAVPLPANGRLWGNRAVWKEPITATSGTSSSHSTAVASTSQHSPLPNQRIERDSITDERGQEKEETEAEADGKEEEEEEEKELLERWVMLQECMTSTGVWEIFLYYGTSAMKWTIANSGQPLRQLQRYPGSMYGGCHIATVDGQYSPRSPIDGKYHIWYHAGQHGNLPTDIYHATSNDLLNWTVTPDQPVLKHQGAGSFAYDQVADPSPLTVGNTAYMAYDGDNNGCKSCAHAAIGLATAPAAAEF